MLSLNEIQLMAQLIDSIEKSAVKLESSYNQKNGKEFNSSKNDILNFQKKISEIIK